MVPLSEIPCPYCGKQTDPGKPYCPHCYLRLPGVTRSAAPKTVSKETHTPRLARSRDDDEARALRKAMAPRVRVRADAEAKPAGQCPACAHPITTKDEWCKWCHWPVNRKT